MKRMGFVLTVTVLSVFLMTGCFSFTTESNKSGSTGGTKDSTTSSSIAATKNGSGETTSSAPSYKETEAIPKAVVDLTEVKRVDDNKVRVKS